jgi:hypothetical protein
VEGVDDKRLLLDEREFSQALTVMRREGNTVSRMVRDGWDSRPLNSLTKNSRARVQRPHISCVGHITKDELRQMLDQTAMANGFANRFIYGCVRRSKELPHGGSLKQSTIKSLGKKICEVIFPEGKKDFFKDYANQTTEGRQVAMNAKAHELWKSMYHDLSNVQSGMLGAICGRAEAQTIRLALLYALLDGKEEIEPVHLRAGLAVWKYCEDSAAYIFGEGVGNAFADELLRVLRDQGGMSRTQISNTFSRNQSHEKISAALTLLRDHGLVKREMRTTSTKGKSAGGRPVEFWVPKGANHHA